MIHPHSFRLVDLGCVFIGHGLKQDFSIVNLYVKPENIIDTVDLFYLPGNRRLSLRFLAILFLDMNIQQEIHDSIEDARTAMMLYKVYLKINSTLKEGIIFINVFIRFLYF